MTMTTEFRRFPTPNEIRAFEQAARQARAEELYRLLALAARKVKSLIVQGAAVLARKGHAADERARRGA
jgi:hypothetical protein